MTGMYFCMLQISPNVSELSLNDFASFRSTLPKVFYCVWIFKIYITVAGPSQNVYYSGWTFFKYILQWLDFFK